MACLNGRTIIGIQTSDIGFDSIVFVAKLDNNAVERTVRTIARHRKTGSS